MKMESISYNIEKSDAQKFYFKPNYSKYDINSLRKNNKDKGKGRNEESNAATNIY